MQLKNFEKQEQARLESIRHQELIKIRADVNEIEAMKAIQRINESQSWFFEKISEINHWHKQAKNK